MSLQNPAEGTSLKDAEAFFRQILSTHPATKLPVHGWGGAKITDFCDANGWLGLWMLKAEVASMTVLGCRLWNVAYQASDKAAEGIFPVDIDSIEMPEEVKSSYTRVAMGDAHLATAALRYMFARHGLQESILEKGAAIHPVAIHLPGQTPELSIGDFLPFPNLADCIESQLAQFSGQAHIELVKIRTQRERDRAPEIQ